MRTAPQSIGIAVVEQSGRYLVGTRGAEGPLAGLAEFPGGKCLPNETPQVCACRECREETGLAVTAVKQLFRQIHEYPHGAVDLHFWLCHPARPEEVSADHFGYVWVPGGELASLQFPEANAGLIKMLTS